MPITTKHTTVYVASDGSEHATLEAAQNAEREIQLEALFDVGAAYGEIATRTAAERVVECWTAIKAIMEAGGAMDPEDWGGANVAPRPGRSIPRRTGTEACRCRTLTPGQLCGACRANVKTDV